MSASTNLGEGSECGQTKGNTNENDHINNKWTAVGTREIENKHLRNNREAMDTETDDNNTGKKLENKSWTKFGNKSETKGARIEELCDRINRNNWQTIAKQQQAAGTVRQLRAGNNQMTPTRRMWNERRINLVL